MVRVPTPLIPALKELSRLHRQGKTRKILQGLDELIVALDSSSDTTYNATSQTLLAICSRLDKLESQLLDGDSNNGTPEFKRQGDLEQKIDSINNRLAQFESAITQLKSNINNQPRRGKSYYGNSYYQGQPVKLQPTTEESLASRLGVSPETIRKEKDSQPPPLFLAWSKRKDTSGIGWEFNEKTGLYHPAI
jgi:hypothetical protein